MSITEHRHTPFDELLVAQRVSRLNLKPTWGIDNLRDATTTTGTGAAAAETNGEIKLSTGTQTTGYVEVQTKERGQYQAGAVGQAGIGIRIPNAPTGSHFAEWGYFDDDNGFGFGQDATGIYTFRLSGGTKTKVYQSSWNIDKLNGSGPSGLTLDTATGYIYNIDFTWYAYGVIFYEIVLYNSADLTFHKYKAHALKVDNSASTIDPNQPLTIRASNNSTETSNFDIYVGGRQFSFVGGVSEPQKRNTPVLLEANSVTTTTYEPRLAVRKKATFNGRTNSVKAAFARIEIGSDQKIYWKITYGDSLDGSWGAITGVPASSTCLEVNTTATSGGSTENRVIDRGFLLASQSRQSTDEQNVRIPLGASDTITLWVKKSGTNATVDAVFNIEEEW